MSFKWLTPEETANCVTHGVGAILSLAGLFVLVAVSMKLGDVRQVMCSAIFGGSMVVLYTASALYHSAPSRRLRRKFLRWDYAGIFLLIAGTYTPFLVLGVGGGVGWTCLALVWGLCAAGIVLVFRSQFPLRSCLANTLLFLVLGWLILAVLKPLFAVLPAGAFALLFAGGFSYTIGTIFLHNNQWRFNHAVWHVFVLGGSVCHWVAVYASL